MPRLKIALPLALLAALAACDESIRLPPQLPAIVPEYVSGSAQQTPAGSALAADLVVRVRDQPSA